MSKLKCQQINNKYYYRRYSPENINDTNKNEIINDIKIISMLCLHEIVDYKFIHGQFDNHIVMIIYDKNNNPIACNIAFMWKYLKYNIMHLGVYLVAKNNQKAGLQSALAHVQMLTITLEYNFNIYFTDLGRSATGFKAIDSSLILYNYPSTKYNINDDKFISLSKQIAQSFYSNQCVEKCWVHKSSCYNYENMVITNSNITDDGEAIALAKDTTSKKSGSEVYNNFVNNLCPNIVDEFIIIIKPSLKKVFLKALF